MATGAITGRRPRRHGLDGASSGSRRSMLPLASGADRRRRALTNRPGWASSADWTDPRRATARGRRPPRSVRPAARGTVGPGAGSASLGPPRWPPMRRASPARSVAGQDRHVEDRHGLVEGEPQRAPAAKRLAIAGDRVAAAILRAPRSRPGASARSRGRRPGLDRPTASSRSAMARCRRQRPRPRARPGPASGRLIAAEVLVVSAARGALAGGARRAARGERCQARPRGRTTANCGSRHDPRQQALRLRQVGRRVPPRSA